MSTKDQEFHHSEINKASDTCPYIGIKGERGSYFGYPSPSNSCFKVINPTTIKLSHQENFCLNSSFIQCEVYQNIHQETLPATIRRDVEKSESWRGNNLFRLGIAGAIALLIIVVFLFLIFQRPLYEQEDGATVPFGTISPSSMVFEVASLSITATEENFILGLLEENTPSPSLSISHTPTTTNIPTNTSTFTPENTPGPGFETPFGPENSYLIHVVMEGETYYQIAQDYDTSIEVLQATNLLPEGIGLRSGLIIVILPRVKDPSGSPRFVSVLVDKPITIQEVAQVYQSNAAEIQKYNQIDPNKPIPIGRWLIIPYP